jgi:hypothetical protein
MSDNTIRSILNDVVGEEIPPTQVNLWPALKAKLVAGKHLQTQQGYRMNNIKPRFMPRFALAISLVLALLVLFIATPQGRSFAQDVIGFFTRTEEAPIQGEDSQIETFASGETIPTALPPSPLISVAEAEAQVGFDVAKLPAAPAGFDYLGVRLYGNNVSMDYMTEGYGHLIIMQSQGGFYQSEWDFVPAYAVVPVKIGKLDGELVQGSFVRYPGETTGTWNPDAAFTHLRWVEDGLWIEISLYGDAHEYLDMEGLLALAENLTFQP